MCESEPAAVEGALKTVDALWGRETLFLKVLPRRVLRGLFLGDGGASSACLVGSRASRKDEWVP